MPQAGPSALEITSQASVVSAYTSQPRKYVYDLIDVDDRVAQLVSTFHDGRFKHRFGMGSSAVSAVIGVGDELTVTIFEASTNGLFSTAENKAITVRIVVQPDGRASIPYVGNIRLVGRTLESARQTILSALKGKAVEPDVLVNLSQNASRTVTVSGEVERSTEVPLSLTGDRVMEAIAKAGGPTRQPHDTVVSLTRNGKRVSTRLATLIRTPSENVYVSPGDQIFLEYDPARFVVLGSSGKKGRIEFNAPEINVIEAVALAGGQVDTVADPRGVFVFRMEAEHVLRGIYGDRIFAARVAAGLWPSAEGAYPVVYQIDMSEPESYLFAQSFKMRSGDVLYMSLHPATDLTKFLQLMGLSLSTAVAAAAL